MITHLIKVILTAGVIAGSYYTYINFNFTEAAKYIDEISQAFKTEDCYIEEALQSGGDSINKCKISSEEYLSSGNLFQSAVWSNNELIITNHTSGLLDLIKSANSFTIIGSDGKKYVLEVESYDVMDGRTIINVAQDSTEYNFKELYISGLLPEI